MSALRRQLSLPYGIISRIAGNRAPARRPSGRAARGWPTARRRRGPGSRRPSASRPRGEVGWPRAARARPVGRSRCSVTATESTGRPRRPMRSPASCDDAVVDERSVARRPVDPPHPASRLREPVDHDLARRGDPPRRRARASTASSTSRTWPSASWRSTTQDRVAPRRSASLRARRLLVGDPRGRRARSARRRSTAPGASCARRPGSRPRPGARSRAATSRTRSRTSSPCSSWRPS